MKRNKQQPPLERFVDDVPFVIPPEARANILAGLAKAIAAGVRLEDTEGWQNSMRLAVAAKDVTLLCELTRHWDWLKLQRDARNKLEKMVKAVGIP